MIVSHEHPLYQLAEAIDWTRFEDEFGALYAEAVGRPGLPTRRMVGLHYLKYLFDESDESVLAKFIENPYWQFFCGGEYFEHELPCHPTSLVKWRKRIGAGGMGKLLSETLSTAKRERALRASEVKRVHADRAHLRAAAPEQRQALQRARAGGGMYRQAEGASAV